ncbi:MAG: DNA translocase FtsK [bacterium]|nr:DNA translocase FtsK [bacterium]
MAKRKEKKEPEKKGFAYSNEIMGIILILVAIIGICRYGPAGNLISSFSCFLVGVIYPVLLIALLIVGGYLIVKRDVPNFFTSRLIGVYVLVLSLLILLHISYITTNSIKGLEILKETIDNLIISFKNIDAIDNAGGGILGAIFCYIFVSLFSVDGTKIVVVTMILLSVILLTNKSLYDFYSKLKSKIKSLFKRKPKKEQEDDEEEEEEEIAVQSLPVESIPVVGGVDVVKENHLYQLPPISLLKTVKKKNSVDMVEAAKQSAINLERVLQDFDISAKIVDCHVGPTVSQFELEIKAGTKVSRLVSIQKEISLALASDIRLQIPIPGKSTIGVEMPNKVTSPVSFKEVLSCMPEVNRKTILAVGLGKDIMANVKYAEINSTPHLLIAGSTGSGKSVCINCIIASILMRTKPDEVKLIMVDPKKVELNMYNGIPHLLAPVVTDPKKASIVLKNIVVEMERRYTLFESTHTKNIASYNDYCEKNKDQEKIPYIVVIIDELADLMLVAAKEVEDSIMRITQMARAAGIHLIVATQRPSTDVITGVVKANIPSRISFAVSSSIDSRTILDASGAEKLIGKGDMLFKPMGENTPLRIQGAFVSEEELQKIVDYVINQQKASYDDTLDKAPSSASSDIGGSDLNGDATEDALYHEVVDFAIQSGRISASLIQRKYRLGYNRAARIIDLLEERGIIGGANGSKPREVLIKPKSKEGEE